MTQVTISNRMVPFLLFTDGLIGVFLSIFAYNIGLDPNPGWGFSRYALIVVGIILLTVSLYLAMSKSVSQTISMGIKTVILFGHLWVFIFVIYAWFITFGNFTTWQKSTRYYAHLADAFGKGQLYLDIQPGADLLGSIDPYDPDTRSPFNDEIWDMSLYKEKLYIYWGPVPALVMTPFQFRSSKLLPDMYLVYLFFGALFAVNSMLILKSWQWLFSDVPLSNIVASIFLVGLILPILWSLNIPDVYEAAIGAGQFFLLCGIYFSFLAIHDNRKRYLFWAGLFWACSVGSRAINVFSVLYMFGVMVIWILKSQHDIKLNWKKLVIPIVCLLTPLVFGAIIIGMYNWARFDSPIEFGLRYQITIYNLNRDMRSAFLPDYFPYNFYAYIFQPFEVNSRFPFIQPVKFSTLLDELNIIPPKLYAGGPMVGILFSAPFLLLAFLPFISRKESVFRLHSRSSLELRKYILLLLGGSFLINFAITLFYFYGQVRFLVDSVSQIALLAILGYWGLVQEKLNSGTKRIHWYVRLANTLLVVTLLFSFLLSFSSETHRMEKFNPGLMEKINSIFTIQKK